MSYALVSSSLGTLGGTLGTGAIAAGLPSYDAFVEEVKREFADFRIVKKSDSTLMRVIDVLLKIVTLGGQKSFLTSYDTTIGSTVYVAPGWEERDPVSRVITLRHERVHMRQRQRYGALGMAFLYAGPIFPIGLALGRARLEWEAYAETLRAVREYRGEQALHNPARRAHTIAQFVGAGYGWMWPFKEQVGRWHDEAVRAH